jgi:hypothetical protein
MTQRGFSMDVQRQWDTLKQAVNGAHYNHFVYVSRMAVANARYG